MLPVCGLCGLEASVFPASSLPRQPPKDLAEACGYKVPKGYDFSILVRPSAFLGTPSPQWTSGPLTWLPSTLLLSPGQPCPSRSS